MIKVDNSSTRRVFTSEQSDNVMELKNLVELKILEVETNESYDYTQLNIYERQSDAKYLSVYKYKDEIVQKINILLRTRSIPEEFKVELRDLKDHIYLVLIGRFDRLKSYVKNLVDNNSSLIYTNCDDRQTIYYKKYKKYFEDLYTAKLSRDENFKRSFFQLFEDINVCPYCNRNFINPIYKSEKIGCDNIKQAPDIEHFFPKSMFPLLSLSISNLLPSCSFCNKVKSNVNTYDNTKSPYELESSDIKFKFKPINTSKREILVETDLDNAKVLNLDDLYESVHSQYVNDIYFDVLIHPDVKMTSLWKLLNEEYSEKKRKEKEEEWYKSFFRNYFDESDFNKQPLSKLTKELYEHLKEMTGN